MTDYKKEFMEVFHSLSCRYSNWPVWNDLLTMAAISMANVVPSTEKEEREKEYLSTIKKYGKQEQELFPRMFAIVVSAIDENQEQDFLGEMYSSLDLSQHQKGQFFTPYHISEFMAEIQCTDVDFHQKSSEKDYVSVQDPACGSGVMLIAIANCLKKRGYPYQQKVFFMAQDIDRTAALMCYIQMSLLGCPAVVVIGDSLLKPGLHPDNDIWMTPFYYLNSWRFQETAETADGSVEEPLVVVKNSIEYLEETGGQFTLPLDAAS